MKAVAVIILLFTCASEATRSWVGQQETDLNELERLFEDTKSLFNPNRFGYRSSHVVGNLAKSDNKYSAEHNDYQEDGSGVSPTGSGVNPIESELPQAIHTILEFVNQISKEKDELNHESAKEFVEALKDKNTVDDKVKSTFGKGIRNQFVSCEKKILAFVKALHASGLFEKIEHEKVDFAQVVGAIIDKAEKGEGSIVQGLFYVFNHPALKGHPGVKVIKAIGQLIGETACDLKLEGYLEAIGKIFADGIKNGTNDEDEYRRCKPSWLYSAWRCRAIRKFIRRMPRSPVQRALRLMFEQGCTLKEAVPTYMTFSIIKDAIKLGEKVGKLAYIEKQSSEPTLKEIRELYEKEDIVGGDLKLAELILTDMRKGFVVGDMLKAALPYGDEPKSTLVGDETSEDLAGTEAQ